MVQYDRKHKVYISDTVDGAWPTRLDAEAAELPADLVGRGEVIAESLRVALKAARLVVSGQVALNGQPDVYRVASESRPGAYHLVNLSHGCDCEAALSSVTCSHWTAALLVATQDIEPQPDPTCEFCHGTGVVKCCDGYQCTCGGQTEFCACKAGLKQRAARDFEDLFGEPYPG